MIRAIGFDLDNTLFDHGAAAAAGLQSFLDQKGWVYDGVVRLQDEWQRIEERHFSEYITGNLTLVEQRRARMREFLSIASIEFRESELDGFFKEYLNHYKNSWLPYPDVHPALENLQHSGLRLGVLSNGQQEQQDRKVENMGLSHFFDSVLAIGRVSFPKPDARAFLEMCASLKCRPSEVAYVGDDPDTDAIAATKAGLHGIWLNREGVRTPIGVDTQITTLVSLATLPILKSSGFD